MQNKGYYAAQGHSRSLT